MPFKNRAEAALLLAEKLHDLHLSHPLILAIPRGGVPIARIIADELVADLDVVLVRKLRHPFNEEYAIGALDEDGHVTLHETVDESYCQQEIRAQQKILQTRRQLYTPHRKAFEIKGRTILIVDDGIATGSTIMAALHAVRQKKPAKIIVAFAVGPKKTVGALARVADEVVCLFEPDAFQAVGCFFEDFSPISDEEVIALLR